jgi:hypothetical protein
LKIDKTIAALSKRVENLLSGSSPVSEWDNGPNGPSNWDIINNAIKEHPDDSWYIPKENIYNAWTCLVNFTLGNIELRDFALERKFADIRYARVDEYDKKCDDAIERKDWVTYEKLKQQVPPIGMFWCNWTPEEIEYYGNEERFPNLKDEGYEPNWVVRQKYNNEHKKTHNVTMR